MNFFKYIERQKQLIRDRHVGETFLIVASKTIKCTERADCDKTRVAERKTVA